MKTASSPRAVLCCSVAALLFLVPRGHAQLSLGPAGLPTQTFESAPPAADWATRAVLPSSAGSVTSPAQLDAAVNTNAASSVIGVLPSTALLPPGSLGSAQWNSNGRFLQTRPTGNTYTLLLARLRNDTGSNLVAVTVQYELGVAISAGSTAVEEIPAHRVYWSATGENGTWVNIPEFNRTDANASASLTATIGVALPPNAVLYLLWADDNGSASTTAPNVEGGYMLDSFAATGVPAAAVQIAAHPQSQAAAPGARVTFTVEAFGAAPIFYQWLKDGGAIAQGTDSSYVIEEVTLADAGAYSVVVSNSHGAVTSQTAVLTVQCEQPVSITAHPASQSLEQGGSLQLNVGVTGTPPLRFQWFRNGEAVAGATNQSLSRANALPGDSGSYHVLVRNCAGDQTSTQAVVSVSPGPVALVAPTNSWLFRDDGVDLGTAWQASAYDDSSWSNGMAVLGYPANENLPPGNSIATPLRRFTAADPLVQVQTYYFRSRFLFTNDPAEVSVVASNLIDDGAVFYLNGQEVARVGLPDGPITYGTGASRANDIGGTRWDVFSIPTSMFLHGENTMAVEVHQGGAASSDAIFGMSLWAVGVSPTPLAITNQPADHFGVEGFPLALTVGVTGRPAYYQWFHDGAAVSGATGPSLAFARPMPSDAGAYWVVVSNVFGVLTSEVAQVTIYTDELAPELLAAEALGGQSLLIQFSERLLAATATNVANFTVTNTLGGGIAIHSAMLTNGSNIVLTLGEPLAANVNYVLTAAGLADTSVRTNVMPHAMAVPVAREVRLIEFGSFWHYYDPHPAFDDLHPGEGWETLAFSPADWGHDPGAFGYSQTAWSPPVPVATDIGLSPAQTAYFRHAFHAGVSRSGLRLRLRHAVDDGALFYINGKEVARFAMVELANVPGRPVSRRTETPALQEVGDISGESCNHGENLLAVELHQYTTNDTDRFFAAELVAHAESLLTGPMLLLGGPRDALVPENAEAVFRLSAVAAETFQWRLWGTNVPGATNAVFRFPARFGFDGAPVSCVLGNSATTIETTNATLRIIPDTIPPVLLGALANADGTFTLAFSEPLDPAFAIHVGHYIVTNFTGAQPTLIGATLLNGTNVVLAFDPLPMGQFGVFVRGVRDDTAARNAMLPSGFRVGAELVLPFDAPWRYNDTGADLGTTWMEPAYDDAQAGWQSGPGALYTDNPPLPVPQGTPLNLVTADGQRVNTFYFRARVPSRWAAGEALIRLMHLTDDGAVFYWNGAEMFRFNMPPGVPTYTTRGVNAIGDAVVLGGGVFTHQVLNGTNIFAVEVHQNGTFSSDVAMGAELTIHIPAVAIPVPPLPPRLALQRNGAQLTLDWIEAGFTLESAPAVHGPWTPVTNQPPLTIEATDAARFFRLRQ